MRPVILALALGLASHPAVARALDLRGQLGVRYERSDLWSSTGEHSDVPQLDLDAGLAGFGSLFGPGLVDWNGEVAWRRFERSGLGAEEQQDHLTYRANLSLLQSRASPFGLSLGAIRQELDSTSESVAGALFTGTQSVTAYSADAALKLPIRPQLSVGGEIIETTNRGFARPDTSVTSRRLRASTRHGTPAYSYSADYRGNWSEGDFASDNFQFQMVNVRGSATLAKNTNAFIQDNYILRSPTVVDPTNPRFESNGLRAGVDWRDGGNWSRTSYTYDNVQLSAPTLPTRSQLRHEVSERLESRLSTEWTLVGTVGFSASQQRVDVQETAALGQSVGVLGRWRRALEKIDLLLEAGPTIGLLEPEGGGVELGHGASAQAGVGWRLATGRASATYSVSYASDLGGLEGWTFRHALRGELERPLWMGRARGQLELSSTRARTVLAGETGSRNVLFLGSFLFRRFSFQANAGVQSGILGFQDVSGDGLFIPAPYNTHNVFASLDVTGPVVRRLDFVTRAGYTLITAEGRDDQSQSFLLGGLNYAIGGLVLSAENRYTVSGTGSLTAKENRFIVRASRRFGVRY